MKNVMWKGMLGSSIDLDTISNKNGLYGLGPESYLAGEIIINDGQVFVSKVKSDSTMTVAKTSEVTAPFFVYAYVQAWEESELPSAVGSIDDLEKYINDKTKSYKRPFAYKLIGSVSSATIHIQNLPSGTKVSSPQEAHQGQTNYSLENEEVEIIGFFSTKHQGIFTHHDSYLHMHLISKDETKMGHLDEVDFNKMTLYLPKK
jgi:acetolactate decarboxylase